MSGEQLLTDYVEVLFPWLPSSDFLAFSPGVKPLNRKEAGSGEKWPYWSAASGVLLQSSLWRLANRLDLQQHVNNCSNRLSFPLNLEISQWRKSVSHTGWNSSDMPLKKNTIFFLFLWKTVQSGWRVNHSLMRQVWLSSDSGWGRRQSTSGSGALCQHAQLMWKKAEL